MRIVEIVADRLTAEWEKEVVGETLDQLPGARVVSSVYRHGDQRFIRAARLRTRGRRGPAGMTRALGEVGS
jgi:hypothetical protein